MLTVLMLWSRGAAVETLPVAEAAKSLALITVSCLQREEENQEEKAAAVDTECVTQHDGKANRQRLTHNLTSTKCLCLLSRFPVTVVLLLQ